VTGARRRCVAVMQVVSADVEKQGMASEGESGHQEGGPSDAWSGRAGGGGDTLHDGGRGEELQRRQNSAGEQRGSGEGEEREETSMGSYVKLKRSKGLTIK
jgi:hypothetical protein